MFHKNTGKLWAQELQIIIKDEWGCLLYLKVLFYMTYKYTYIYLIVQVHLGVLRVLGPLWILLVLGDPHFLLDLELQHFL